MSGIRSIDGAQFSIDELVAAKGARTVSLCIPCRDEASTIGAVVAAIRNNLVERSGLIDELVVIDDRSTDDSGQVALSAGATVVPIATVHDQFGDGHGKGNAMWASLLVTSGDIVVWIDGDLTSFEPSWVARLVGPLLDDESIALVKAHAHRPQRIGGGGGRTTELVARPLISMFFPELAELIQPLGGEYAVRRTIVEQLPIVEGWGVEIAMLIDIATNFGVESIAQVAVGVREHRHQSLEALSLQAAEVMATILGRIPGTSLMDDINPALRRPGERIPLNLAQRPPVASVRRGSGANGEIDHRAGARRH